MKPSLKEERRLWRKGHKFVCGIDEAGRGALAGPLVAGAVILNLKTRCIYNDSKQLKVHERNKLFEKIKKDSVSWSVGIASVDEINRYGIQSATYLAYTRAISTLNPMADFLLIDHYRLPGVRISQNSLTKGDTLSQSIAAASIVAKVTRDSMMVELDQTYAGYDFHLHKGYGTKRHLKNLTDYGPSPIHRSGFIDKEGSNQLNFI